MTSVTPPAIPRRAVLAGLAASVATTTVSAQSTLIPRARLTLTVGSAFPRGFSLFFPALERLAETLEVLSEGKLGLAVSDALPTQELFGAVVDRKLDGYLAFESYWAGIDNAYDFFSAVPFGLTASEMDAWLLEGGQDHWAQLAAIYGLVPFSLGATQFQMAGWFRDAVRDDPAALRGKRIRAIGLSAEVYARAGAEVLATPGDSLVDTFARGGLDAVEWFGPSADEALGLPGATDIMGPARYYGPSFNRPSQLIALVLGIDAHARLDPWRRRIWQVAVADTANWLTASFRRFDVATVDRYRLGMSIRPERLPSSLLNGMGDIAAALLFERANANPNPLAREIYDSYVTFRARALSHSKTADESFYASRLLPFRFDRRP